MTPEFIFKACSQIALIGWLILIISSPKSTKTNAFVVGVIVTLFALVYAWLIILSFTPADINKFNSIEGVMQLFQNKIMLTAGWVHYLAFDLMAGIWMRQNAVLHNINRWLLIPCYLLTFMFGPCGLLLYLIIRLIKTRNYFCS